MLSAAILLDTEGIEIIVTGGINKGADKLLNIINQGFRPFTVSLYNNPDSESLNNLIPFVSNYSTIDGKAAAYICKNFTCNQPVTDVVNLKEMLQ